MGYFYFSLFSNLLLLIGLSIFMKPVDESLSMLVVLNRMTIKVFKNRYDPCRHNHKCFLYLPIHLLLSVVVMVIDSMLDSFIVDIFFIIIVFLTFMYAVEKFIKFLDNHYC